MLLSPKLLLLVSLAAILSALSYGYRLPSDVVPIDYRLDIVTNLADEDRLFNFSGKVSIDVACLFPTDNITLHSKNLIIHENLVTVRLANHKGSYKLNIAKVSLVPKDDFLVIKLSEPLKAEHKYVVEISFEGTLGDGLAGYYRSYYLDKSGERRWLAVTQFEPTDARRAFPCFDEPAFKAKFTINLGRSERYTSLSNMPIAKTEEMNDKVGWFWDRYETTVPMSTYLVAYAVTDFGYETSSQAGNNVTFRIWARKDALNQIAFSKDAGPKFLRFFEEYFEIDYPLPKQDMIAVPDFSAGAMENWGLITYREAYLLFDQKQSSPETKESIASVVAHELAHQWFGNLVTMKWWTDLWLNEGFATYMSSIALEAVFPHWKSLIDDTASNILDVFNFDSLKSSHPVSVPIGHPKEISEIFDAISYKKGSYLLHMMANFLGSDTLRKGVSNYLNAHKFNNAEKDDLWESITNVGHQVGTLPINLTIKTVMDPWALKTGFPIITVDRDYEKGSLDVKQERFFRDRDLSGSDPTKWWIPLTYTTQEEMTFNDTKVKSWLSPEVDNLTIPGFTTSTQWVLFNLQLSGLYRVNYDETNWNLLINFLNEDDFGEIPVLNRVLLIDDAANLAAVGRLGYKVFFDLIRYLKREREYLPWKAALRNINRLDGLVKRTSAYPRFREYIRTIVRPIYDGIGGFEKLERKDEVISDIRHKVQVVSTACRFSSEECVMEAARLFKMVQESNVTVDDIPNELRGIVYCNGVRYGGETEWMYVWSLYEKSNVASVKSMILTSLGCSRLSWMLRRYLEMALDKNSSIRKQDVASVFRAVISDEVGFQITKDFVGNNIKALYQRLRPSESRLADIIKQLASLMINEEEQSWLKTLIDSNPECFRDIKNGVRQALETSNVNTQWHNTNYKDVHQYLSGLTL